MAQRRHDRQKKFTMADRRVNDFTSSRITEKLDKFTMAQRHHVKDLTRSRITGKLDRKIN